MDLQKTSRPALNRGAVLSTAIIWPILRDILETVQRDEVSYYYALIESRMRAFSWYRNWWSWMALNRVMADISHHFTQSGSFGSQLR